MKSFAISIIRTLREHGHEAYLVGGCVRDLLLNREPADYDVATSATPDEVMHIFPETYAVGAQFGVVLVPAAESVLTARGLGSSVSTDAPGDRDLASPVESPLPSQTVEVATFRSDIGYTDGRHPDGVRFSKDAREDVERRDFTINGLLFDPIENRVLDFVGGQKDMKTNTIRAIGEPGRRFAEDRLRMLRAVRFAARLGYLIEPLTFREIQKQAGGTSQVSRERVRDELTKMLTEGHPRQAFLLLDETGLLSEILPEISAMKGVEQPAQFHPEGDVFMHTLLLLENLPRPRLTTLAWGALLHDVGKPPTFRVAERIRFDGHVEVGVKMAEEICRRLHFSNHDSEQILRLIANHMRFGHAMQMNQSTLKRFLRLPRFDEHLDLHRLDCLASHGDLTTYNFVKERLAATPAEVMRPAPLIRGSDLIAAGYTPGPRFKQILSAVEDGQLEGRLRSREDAMELVGREFPL
jgi:poly(A) polymerase